MERGGNSAAVSPIRLRQHAYKLRPTSLNRRLTRSVGRVQSSVWEATLAAERPDPSCSPAVREDFIRSKYIRRHLNLPTPPSAGSVSFNPSLVARCATSRGSSATFSCRISKTTKTNRKWYAEPPRAPREQTRVNEGRVFGSGDLAANKASNTTPTQHPGQVESDPFFAPTMRTPTPGYPREANFSSNPGPHPDPLGWTFVWTHSLPTGVTTTL